MKRMDNFIDIGAVKFVTNVAKDSSEFLDNDEVLSKTTYLLVI